MSPRLPFPARTALRAAPADHRSDLAGDLVELHARRVARMSGARAWLATTAQAIAMVGALLAWKAGSRLRAGAVELPLSAPEIRLAVRATVRQPALAVTATIAMAAAIGLATAGFTLYHTVAFARLPFDHDRRFVGIQIWSAEGAIRGLGVDAFRLLQHDADGFVHVGAFRGGPVDVEYASGEVEPVRGARITPGSMRLLPFVPLLGRTLLEGDAAASAPPVAVVRASFWRRRLGARADVVGRTLEVVGSPVTIVGVLPDEAGFPTDVELWIALREPELAASLAGTGQDTDLFGVLRPATPIEAAARQLGALAAAIGRTDGGGDVPRFAVVPFGRAFAGRPGKFDSTMIVTVTVLLLVLLVVSANVANLVLARTAARATEMAVRTALGASRARLVGQVFLEVLVMGCAAAAIGLAASQYLLSWFGRVVGPDLPPWVHFTIGPTTTAFVVAITLAAAAIAGAVPALRATRRDPASALQRAGRGATPGIGFGWISSSMVVAQVALSVALLSGALGLAHAWTAQITTRVPIPEERILMGRVSLRPGAAMSGGLDQARARQDTMRALTAVVLRALAATPGVVAVGAANALPRMEPRPGSVRIEALPGENSPEPHLARVVDVSGGFFDALDTRVSAGRLLSAPDFGTDASDAVLVDEPFVRRFLGGRNPVGRRIQLPARPPEAAHWSEIVGVVPDLGMSGSDPTIAGVVYRPMGPFGAFWITVRGSGEAGALAGAVRHAVATADPGVRIDEVAPIAHAGWDARAFYLGIGSSLMTLGAVTLLLAAAGMYAILSFAVALRTREIGVRVALGADRSRILGAVLGRSLVRLGAGAVMGWVLALALDRVRASFNGLPAPGPWVTPIVIAVMLAAGAIASWLPTRRALRIRPMDALRAD